MGPIKQSYGYQSYGKEIMHSIQANGSVFLEGTKVLGIVQINGSLEADEAALEDLQVNGPISGAKIFKK